MDAVEVLKPYIDAAFILKHYGFTNINEDGNMIRTCCHLHGGNNPTAFAWNTENNLWCCHTGGCGAGDVYTLIMKVEEISFPASVKRLAEIMNVDIGALEIRERKQEETKEIERYIKAMMSKRVSAPLPYVFPGVVKDVTRFRNFRIETIKHFGMVFCDEVELVNKNEQQYHLYSRLVLPIDILDNSGRYICGVSLRKTRAADNPKWLHLPRGIDTGEILYNYHMYQGEGEIVVCESPFNVWSYYEIGVFAVCTFGAHLTPHQYKLLLKSGADLVWSYDGDDAGRIATQKARFMCRYKANMSVVHFDEGEDAENIEREVLYERYLSKKKCY